MPKLQYILRTSPCSNNPRLSIFDDTLRQGLSTILNVSLSDDQWLQASLPVQKGSLGIRSAGMLASSTYLASAAATLRLQNAILANSCCLNPDPAVGEALIIWKTQSHTVEPASPAGQYQKVWDNSGFKRNRQPCESCTSFWRLAKCYTDLISRSLFVG